MALDRAIAVQQQHVHGPFIGLRVFVVPRPDGQIGHAVPVQVAQAGQRTAERVAGSQSAGREAGQAVADLRVALDRAAAGKRDAGNIVFDFAIAGRAGRIRRRCCRAQPEAGVSFSSETKWHGGECQRPIHIVRPVGHGHRRAFRGVLEDAIVVVIDPAV